jgi:Macrocin-O-methyltransferase (TylF).
MRFFSLIQLVQYVVSKKDVNSFVECGCWKGHSSYIIAKIIKESNRNIKFHIFDSFEGLSTSTHNDSNFFSRKNKEKKNISRHFSSSENFVKDEVLKDFNFVETYKGWIPEKFNEVKDKSFSLIHIDVDLYEPTMDSLKFFYPKIVKGGIIICDDYNITAYPGAKKAKDESFLDTDYSFF